LTASEAANLPGTRLGYLKALQQSFMAEAKASPWNKDARALRIVAKEIRAIEDALEVAPITGEQQAEIDRLSALAAPIQDEASRIKNIDLPQASAKIERATKVSLVSVKIEIELIEHLLSAVRRLEESSDENGIGKRVFRGDFKYCKAFHAESVAIVYNLLSLLHDYYQSSITPAQNPATTYSAEEANCFCRIEYLLEQLAPALQKAQELPRLRMEVRKAVTDSFPEIPAIFHHQFDCDATKLALEYLQDPQRVLEKEAKVLAYYLFDPNKKGPAIKDREKALENTARQFMAWHATIESQVYRVLGIGGSTLSQEAAIVSINPRTYTPRPTPFLTHGMIIPDPLATLETPKASILDRIIVDSTLGPSTDPFSRDVTVYDLRLQAKLRSAVLLTCSASDRQELLAELFAGVLENTPPGAISRYLSYRLQLIMQETGEKTFSGDGVRYRVNLKNRSVDDFMSAYFEEEAPLDAFKGVPYSWVFGNPWGLGKFLRIYDPAEEALHDFENREILTKDIDPPAGQSFSTKKKMAFYAVKIKAEEGKDQDEVYDIYVIDLNHPNQVLNPASISIESIF
jgi:hypothetical protein